MDVLKTNPERGFSIYFKFSKNNDCFQYNRQRLLEKCVHLNGHNLGFDPRTLKLELPCTTQTQHQKDSTAQQRSFV